MKKDPGVPQTLGVFTIVTLSGAKGLWGVS